MPSGIVLHRVLKTLESSRSLDVRMSRLPPNQAAELYYRTLLGPDWKDQFVEDWNKGVQDVNDGFVSGGLDATGT